MFKGTTINQTASVSTSNVLQFIICIAFEKPLTCLPLKLLLQCQSLGNLSFYFLSHQFFAMTDSPGFKAKSLRNQLCEDALHVTCSCVPNANEPDSYWIKAAQGIFFFTNKVNS
jgi:hypothetical protein